VSTINPISIPNSNERMMQCHLQSIRRAVKFLFLATLAFGALGCWGGDSDESSSIKEVEVGVIPISEVAPIYVGIEKEFFRDEGLEIDMERMAGGAEILPAVESGDLDIGFSNIVSLIIKHNKSNSLVAYVGGTYETKDHLNHALIIPDGASTEVKEYAGKTFAVNTRNNIEELMLRRYLRNKGLDPTDIEYRTMPFPVMERALEAGDIDAASVVEPFIRKMESAGYDIMARQYLGGEGAASSDSVMVATYVAKQDWLNANDSTAMRFKRGLNRAVRFVSEDQNETEVRSIISKYTSISNEVAYNMGLPLMIECVRRGSLSETIRLVQSFPPFEIENPPDPADLLHSELTPLCGTANE